MSTNLWQEDAGVTSARAANYASPTKKLAGKVAIVTGASKDARCESLGMNIPKTI